MKVLVTGGNGQLGRSLARVGGLDFVFTDLPEGDITSVETMWTLTEGVDAIVNCAAWTNVDAAEEHEDDALRVNAMGLAVLGAIAAQRDIPLVHISTDYVFDGRASAPIPEDAATNPLGAYGRTKLSGEVVVRASGCRAAIVRTAWLYSEFGNNFVKTMLRVGAAATAPLRVVDDQRGCPTYAPDLAQAVVTLLEQGIEGCTTYHFCGVGETTWFDFARTIFAEAGLDVQVQPVSTAEYGARAPRPAYSVLSCARIEAAGVVRRDWHDSLRECLEQLTIDN